MKQDITLTTDVPIKSRMYRHLPETKKALKEIIKEHLKLGIISPTNSPYSLPLWLVPKHATGNEPKKYRAVVDYRSLNAIAV